MKKIILDTNFLLIPGIFCVDIFSEIKRVCDFKYELCVIDRTINELEHIVISSKGKYKKAASLSLELIKKNRVKIIKTEKNMSVDDSIVLLSNKNCIVATQDKDLKRRLKKVRIPIITMRQKRYVILERP